MGLFDGISISASGLTAERARMDTIAENLANANSTRGAAGGPYRRKQVVLQEQPLAFSSALGTAMGSQQPGGVRVAGVSEDASPGRRVYDPEHPDADAQGYITLPNVNPVTEMTDLITASRSYEANATALQTAKQMFQRALEVLR